MKIIRLLFLLWIVSSPCVLIGQEVEPAQEFRQFDSEKLEELREDGDYDYEAKAPEERNFIQRFIDNIKRWFANLFATEETSNLLNILLYLVLGIALAFFVIKLAGVELSSVFRPSKAKKELPFEINEELLSEIDFDQEIHKAVSEKQWRYAIRLVYLFALKNLAQKDFIDVKVGKTNQDYLYDLKGSPKEGDFASLSFLFDYTWYGQFEADQNLYDKAQVYFQSMNSDRKR